MTSTITAPAVALSRRDAAASLGYSLDHFERHVQPELKLIRRGRRIVVPVAELERWAAINAEPAHHNTNGRTP